MRIKDEIIGKEVVDISGMLIGKVKDVEVDFESQSLESFVIGKGGISEGLGMSNNEVVVPYDMVQIIGDKVLLKSEIHGE